MILQKITMPEPCHQNWNQMTPVERGRHCTSCSKVVTDFTRMTNGEIINYLTTKNNVCGRFTNDQLPNVNYTLRKQKFRMNMWKRFAILTFVTGLFSISRVDAQTRKSTHNRHRKHGQSFKSDSRPFSTVMRAPQILPVLSAKSIPVSEIKIDMANTADVKTADLTRFEPIYNILGGVQVKGIQVCDDRFSFYLLWRTIFKY